MTDDTPGPTEPDLNDTLGQAIQEVFRLYSDSNLAVVRWVLAAEVIEMREGGRVNLTCFPTDSSTSLVDVLGLLTASTLEAQEGMSAIFKSRRGA